jgi:sec-independent protein translocase protein TatB
MPIALQPAAHQIRSFHRTSQADLDCNDGWTCPFGQNLPIANPASVAQVSSPTAEATAGVRPAYSIEILALRRASPRRVVTTLSRPNCRFSFLGSMMKRMSFSETIFLFVLALIIFGPKKLPEIARQVGKYMNEFKRASNEFKAQIEQEISNLDIQKQTTLPPSSPPHGSTSRAHTLSAASAEAPGAEVPAAEVPATPAASDDEPLFATNSAAVAVAPSSVTGPAISPSDDVTSAASQESHV